MDPSPARPPSPAPPVSPPTRGWTPHDCLLCRALMGFPAHAGMDPRRSSVSVAIGGFPRPRGDGPDHACGSGKCRSVSPPTRGWTRHPRGTGGAVHGFPAHAGWTVECSASRLIACGFPAHAGMDLGAGKPLKSTISPRSSMVHPRVGGETGAEGGKATYGQGPSPRGRGNQSPRMRTCAACGPSPAWAGKPRLWRQGVEHEEVHPRVGGETSGYGVTLWSGSGPSPRGRGNRRQPGQAGRPLGSIPAWAGKPTRRRPSPLRVRVHPRVGGETVATSLFRYDPEGPSPRGRGNRRQARAWRCWSWSIPAWAGKPRTARRRRPTGWVHPRVGGETNWIGMYERIQLGPSPRGRGNPPARPCRPSWPGSIPAWAGKPLRLGHGRSGRGSIPAWAGKPSALRRSG